MLCDGFGVLCDGVGVLCDGFGVLCDGFRVLLVLLWQVLLHTPVLHVLCVAGMVSLWNLLG